MDKAALQGLVERVRDALARNTPLEIRGGGTKAFYGGTPQGLVLSTLGLAGISSYEPSELVITARGGTPLAELEATLAEQGQCLPFEPPRFGDPAHTGAQGGTVGGMVAAGRGSTLSETSQITPSTPRLPASVRARS